MLGDANFLHFFSSFIFHCLFAAIRFLLFSVVATQSKCLFLLSLGFCCLLAVVVGIVGYVSCAVCIHNSTLPLIVMGSH